MSYRADWRFAAWGSGGFLAQKFNRRTELEPTTKQSYEALNRPLRQTAVSAVMAALLSVIVLQITFSSFAILQKIFLSNCNVVETCPQLNLGSIHILKMLLARLNSCKSSCSVFDYIY